MRFRKSVLGLLLALVVVNVAGVAFFLTQPFPLPLEADIHGAAWAPNGRSALLVGEGGAVLRYDGRETWALRSPTTVTLRDVDWSPDSRLALVAGDQGTLLLYDAENDAVAPVPWSDPAAQLTAVSWIDRHTALVAGARGLLLRFDPSVPEVVTPMLSGCTAPGTRCPDFRGLAWRPGGDFALAVGDDGMVLRDTGSRGGAGDGYTVLNEGSVTYWDVDWKRPEGEVALIVGDRGVVRRFNGTALGYVPSPTDVSLRAVAWKPLASVALLAGEGGALFLYNDFTRTITPVPGATSMGIRDLAWNLRTESALLVAAGGTLRTYPSLGVDPAGVVAFWAVEALLATGAGGVAGIGAYRSWQRRRRHIPAEVGFAAAPALDFEAKHLLYQVRVKNASTVTLGDVTVTPRIVKGEFVLPAANKVLPLLRPGAAAVASFQLRSGGVPQEIEVDAAVRYYDGETESYRTLRVPAIAMDLALPALRGETLDLDRWKEMVSRFFSAEEKLRLYIRAEEAFQEVIDTVRSLDLAVVETRTATGKTSYTVRASLFARDAGGRGFGAYITASGPTGGKVASALTVRVFTEREEALYGFYHAVFGEMEARLRRRDESLDIMKRITELTLALREKEEAPEAVVEITRMRTTLEESFERLRERLEEEAEVRSVEELNEVYKELASGLIADGTLDPDVGRRRIREQLSEDTCEELERFPEAHALLAEAEASEALKMAELLPESGRNALLLVYPSVLEVYLRERLKTLLPGGVTVLLGAEFGHINTRKRDWEDRWATLSLGSCIHVIDNNQYLFLADAARWNEGLMGRLHEVRDLRNLLAHPGGAAPTPALVRQRVFALLEEIPRALRPIPATRPPRP